MSDPTKEVLKRQWSDAPHEELLPNGNYLLRGRNATYRPSSNADNSDQILFAYGVKEPMSDVDDEELAAIGYPNDYDVGQNEIFYRLWFDPQKGRDWDNLKAHLVKHGIDPKGNLEDSLKQFKGTEIVGTIEQRTYTDKAGQVHPVNDAVGFSPVEASY